MISISALRASVAVKMPSRAPSSSLTMTLPTLRSDIRKATSSRGVEAVTLSGFSAMISEACTWNFSAALDRKSTRLNSSHVRISYAVFCLKKKKEEERVKAAERDDHTALKE